MLRHILETLRFGCIFAAVPLYAMVCGGGAPAFYIAVALFTMGCGYYIGQETR